MKSEDQFDLKEGEATGSDEFKATGKLRVEEEERTEEEEVEAKECKETRGGNEAESREKEEEEGTGAIKILKRKQITWY